MEMPTTVVDYIAQFPPDVQRILTELRTLIRDIAPEAEEKISYGIPGYAQNGALVWFAAFKRHIGFYPTASGIAAFKDELAPYKSAKGSVQFPLGQPIPYELIRKIVFFKLAENTGKAKGNMGSEVN